MILSLLTSIAIAAEPICGAMTEPPEIFQVAWIAPINERAWPSEHIEVVRFVDFRLWARDEAPDAKAVLHALGMLSERTRREVEANEYKITIFDVKRDWLCRPIESFDEGDLVEGIPICHTREQRQASWSRRFGFTGCGAIKDTQSQNTSFEVFRIPWNEAIIWGFTTMPLDRFLDGA